MGETEDTMVNERDLQIIILIIVVPFKVRYLVSNELSKSIDDVSAEVWVDVGREELPDAVSVLGPVGVVANHFVLCLTYMQTLNIAKCSSRQIHPYGRVQKEKLNISLRLARYRLRS